MPALGWGDMGIPNITAERQGQGKGLGAAEILAKSYFLGLICCSRTYAHRSLSLTLPDLTSSCFDLFPLTPSNTLHIILLLFGGSGSHASPTPSPCQTRFPISSDPVQNYFPSLGFGSRIHHISYLLGLRETVAARIKSFPELEALSPMLGP